MYNLLLYNMNINAVENNLAGLYREVNPANRSNVSKDLYDGSSYNMNNNYTVSTDYKMSVNATKNVYIHKIVLYSQSGVTHLGGGFMGGSALVNGFRLYYKLNSSSDKVYISGSGNYIKNNNRLHQVCDEFELVQSTSFLHKFVWNFENDPLYLDENGEIGFEIEIEDLSSFAVLKAVAKFSEFDKV